MPTISMFYGILVSMFFKDIDYHNLPHIHAEYQDFNVVLSIPEGEVLKGSLPIKKLKMLQAWIVIHEDELMTDWKLTVRGEPVFKIEPLR
jgi:hypothetical protein